MDGRIQEGVKLFHVLVAFSKNEMIANHSCPCQPPLRQASLCDGI